MWPKALTQLVELAPHITRLLPLADRYFKDKTTGDDATRKTLDDLQTHHRAALHTQRATLTDCTDRLHADLGAITSQQTTQGTQTAALQRQLAALDGQITGFDKQIGDLEKHLISTRADALAAKQATESLEGRLHRIEAAQGRAQTLAIVALALLAARQIAGKDRLAGRSLSTGVEARQQRSLRSGEAS